MQVLPKGVKVLDKLRKELVSSVPQSSLRHYVVISSTEHHTHNTECVKASGDLHPLLIKEVQNLVKNGKTSVRDIKLLLEQFVEIHFSEENKPEHMNVMFFPTDKIIYNHMYRSIYTLKKTVIEQEALKNQVDDCQRLCPNDKVFFRPYCDENGDVQSVLFCYQASWQQELMKKYGHIALLDATYKTCKYELPLFFITVKANVCYLVVGMFLIQIENTVSIQEALEIFKGWNPDWAPKYWMTDFSEPEIRAIEETFPSSIVHLCAFHREQSWQRWLKKGGNLNDANDSDVILKTWRNIAVAETKELYQQYVEEMRNSEVFKRNPKALVYFINQWLPAQHRWVKAFDTRSAVLCITTNNGAETMNKLLKHTFLKYNSDKTLTGLVKIIIKDFLPSLLKKYCQKNSTVKCYNTDLPSFLHGKTSEFISHVMKRYTSAHEIDKSSITVIDDGLFCVNSSTSEDVSYIVNFEKPSCTCADFQKYMYPCKHFCAIFILFPECGFEKLPTYYKDNPLMCLDDKFGYGTKSYANGNMSSEHLQQNTFDVSNDEVVAAVAVDTPSALGRLESKKSEIRELAKCIINLSYNCQKEEAALEGVQLLCSVVELLKASNPKLDGLPLTNV